MKKYLLALLLFLTPVGGCSSLGALGAAAVGSAASDGLNTDVELTVGQKNEEVKVETKIGNTNKYEVQTIETIEQVPAFFMMLLILGWLLPSPSEMWRGFLKLLPWSNKNGSE